MIVEAINAGLVMRIRVWPAASISLALHAALLAGLGPTAGLGRAQPPAAAMMVRMLMADTGEKAPIGATDPLPAKLDLPDDAPHPLLAAPVRPSETAEGPTDRQTDRSPVVGRDAPVGKRTTAAAALATGGGVRAAGVAPLHGVDAVPATPAAVEYLSGARMDPGPQPLDDIEPVFPAEAGLQEGSVVLRIFINEAGTVDDVKVVRSSPHGLFEGSAISAFAAARFAPGRVLGIPVKSQITVEVQFTPFNRGATVSGRSY